MKQQPGEIVMPDQRPQGLDVLTHGGAGASNPTDQSDRSDRSDPTAGPDPGIGSDGSSQTLTVKVYGMEEGRRSYGVLLSREVQVRMVRTSNGSEYYLDQPVTLPFAARGWRRLRWFFGSWGTLHLDRVTISAPREAWPPGITEIPLAMAPAVARPGDTAEIILPERVLTFGAAAAQ